MTSSRQGSANLRRVLGSFVILVAIPVLALNGCKRRTGNDAGNGGTTDAGGGGSTDSGGAAATDAANTDAAMTCTPQMGQMACMDSPEGYGVIVGFVITASGGAETLMIDQVSIQVNIGGAMFPMPFIDPMPAAGPLTFPHMLLLDICSPTYGAGTVTVQGLAGGTAVAEGMAMTVPDTAPCALVMANVDMTPL
jgi:hypothetical protein